LGGLLAMKKAACALLMALGISGMTYADTDNKDVEGIKKVIQSAYVDGILNLGNVSDIKKGFHPDFGLLYVRGNQLGKLTRDRWLKKIEHVKKEKTINPASKASVKFLYVDAIGDTGMAKFEIRRGSKLVYTDYLTLLRFAEGWRIVSKISHHHN
jgi:hypothetical protein